MNVPGYHSPSMRVSRFEEAVQIIKKLFGNDPVNFTGKYYTIKNLNLLPKPAQRPHPPILLGGGSPRTLSIATCEADIVSVNVQTTADGSLNLRTFTAEAADQQVELVRRAAGERFDSLELNTLILAVIITNDPLAAAEKLARDWEIDPGEITIAELLESPHLLFGSEEEIIEQLQGRRERYGISYFTIFGEEYMDAFAPIVARLAGR